MKRIIMMVIRNIFAIPVYLAKLLYYSSHTDRYTDEQLYGLIRKIDFLAIRGGNVRVDGYGMENIPKEDGIMFFPNHQGLFDMLAVVSKFERPLSVVFKKEVENVFFIKQVAACLKAYVLDRDDVRQGMKVILNVAKDVAGGKNVLIFAEGTRSRNGNQVGEFKGGSFKAATKAKCPIVPVALIDSFKPFDTNTIRQTVVQVHFLEPLYYEDYRDMKTTEIAALVQERIQKKIDENVSAFSVDNTGSV